MPSCSPSRIPCLSRVLRPCPPPSWSMSGALRPCLGGALQALGGDPGELPRNCPTVVCVLLWAETHARFLQSWPTRPSFGQTWATCSDIWPTSKHRRFRLNLGQRRPARIGESASSASDMFRGFRRRRSCSYPNCSGWFPHISGQLLAESCVCYGPNPAKARPMFLPI